MEAKGSDAVDAILAAAKVVGGKALTQKPKEKRKLKGTVPFREKVCVCGCDRCCSQLSNESSSSSASVDLFGKKKPKKKVLKVSTDDCAFRGSLGCFEGGVRVHACLLECSHASLGVPDSGLVNTIKKELVALKEQQEGTEDVDFSTDPLVLRCG